jgi:hypothetical protein
MLAILNCADNPGRHSSRQEAMSALQYPVGASFACDLNDLTNFLILELTH